jgi:DNA polymerase-1
MPILLLDGHNLLYRAFTSLPRSIVSSSGEPINGLHGLLSVILRLVRVYNGEHVVVAFDVPDVPTFRHQLYPGYQAQRGPLGGEYAEEFRRQVSMAQELLPAIGVHAVTAPGFEADDIMGTLAVAAAGRDTPSLVVSTDRDLLQLVRPNVEVLSPLNPPFHARSDSDVEDRMGVPAAGVTTLKALAGDSSDNIPGVRGIGNKGAAALVKQYGTLEAMYSDLDRLPTRAAGALRDQRETAFLFRELVTIRTDLALAADASNLWRPRISADTRVGQILSEHGYRRPERG